MAEKIAASNWSEEEFGSIDFGDERLNRRVIKLAGQLSEQPQAFINQACEDWTDTKAAYRFFDNEKVDGQEIISAHSSRVVARMKKYDIVLAIQDTTEIDYTAHLQKQGLGQIGNEVGRGLLMHTTLALTTEGLPLGVLNQKIWARSKKKKSLTTAERKRVPIKDKESQKWLDALEQTMACVPAAVQVVTVGDREIDIFEFLLKAEQLGADYLIRAMSNRCLTAADKSLWEELAAMPVAARVEVEVAEKKGEPARTAKVSVRYAEVELKPPQRLIEIRMDGWKPVKLWAVYVKEVYAPAGVTPLEWMLLTNVPVNNFEDALERIAWYTKRWSIELYHKVLKSGCKVEDCLLETAARLQRYLALMSVIAWRLFWLTHINRQSPEASCTTILAAAEWQALYCRINKTTELPKEPPTVRQAVRWIARLGGFLGRKNDGEPGITVIWRGWQRLTDIVATWLILHTPKSVGNR
jgi:hypothetical protein